MSENHQPESYKTSSPIFVAGTEADRCEVDPGIWRQILGYSPDLMTCRVWFETGAVGTAHSHPHSQTTYVEQGRFRFRIGAEERDVVAGDCIQIPSGVVHGSECLEAGILLDSFSPARADFLPGHSV